MKKEKEKEKEKVKETESSVNNENNSSIPDQENEIIKYEERIKSLEQEVQDSKDRLLRKAAEFENYKRRTENDQMNLLKYAAEPFIIKLLTIIDDFERSIKYIEKAKEIESVKEGIYLVYDKFKKLLDEQGVKKIDAVGKPFDVDFHEAMLQRTVEDTLPHTVLDEIESGYMYKDRVIRHSKVIVSDDQSGSNNIMEE
jgi:molecular chaperone GrpE